MKIKTLASGSSGNCYSITHDLMIECGISVKDIMRGVEKLPSFCLVSHSHKDHSRSAAELEQIGVKIICGPETAKALNLKNPIVIEDNKAVIIGNYGLCAYSVEHDVECYAFMIASDYGRLFFATDCQNLNKFKGKLNNLDCIMIEANYKESELIKSGLDNVAIVQTVGRHQSIESAVDFLKSVSLRRTKIHLIHLSNRYANINDFKQIIADELGKNCEVH